MCIAIPAKITQLDDNCAIVDMMGLRKRIDVQLVDNLKTGDTVLVHAGFAIQKIDISYYNFLNKTLRELLQSNTNQENSNHENNNHENMK